MEEDFVFQRLFLDQFGTDVVMWRVEKPEEYAKGHFYTLAELSLYDNREHITLDFSFSSEDENLKHQLHKLQRLIDSLNSFKAEMEKFA